MAKQDKKERDVLIQQEAEAMRAILNIPDDELVLMDWDDTGEEQFHQKILPEDVQPKENWIELINIPDKAIDHLTKHLPEPNRTEIRKYWKAKNKK